MFFLLNTIYIYIYSERESERVREIIYICVYKHENKIPGYHHNDFVATQAPGPECMSCHKTSVNGREGTLFS